MYSYLKIEEKINLPLINLIEEAHEVHKRNFESNEIQTSQLLSIKTGGCPENCSYCPQSAHYATDVEKTALLTTDEIKGHAIRAKESGATRFCMGAAWREVKNGPDFDDVLMAVETVKGLGLEVCCTLGMLNLEQAQRLKEAGLYAYNHNIDTSVDNYNSIITTRDFNERIQTIKNVRESGISVCTGGILGLGETQRDRIIFLKTLAELSPQPESVTINTLVRAKGTPLANEAPLDPSILVRVIATARILMPKSMIRLSAGRKERTGLEQLLCFYAGANSIFYGEKLLTTPNPLEGDDLKMIKSFGLKIKNASL
jgi:biotin synthase